MCLKKSNKLYNKTDINKKICMREENEKKIK